MNKNMKCFLTFLLGLSAGGATAYIFTRKKYETMIETEVTSARETYNRLAKELAEKNEMEKKKMFNEYTEKVEEYINDAIAQDDESVEKESNHYDDIPTLPGDDLTEDEYIVKHVKRNDTPSAPASINTPASPIYEIDATEYGSNDNYKLVSLNYYSDEIMTDENEEVIEDPESIISPVIFEKLAIYEMNDIYTTYVRNDVRRCDYEIFLTGHSYEG